VSETSLTFVQPATNGQSLTMKAAEVRAVTMRLDVLRDMMVELVAALPSDRSASFAASSRH
jgi:hypothetical protein